ncbi:MAG: methionyl-tRNA formyltransferase [Bacteroidota bacterium]
MSNKKDFKVVFMGTPEFAVASLDAICKSGFDVVGVVTAPDRPAGRGQKIKQSAVKTYAVENDLNVLQPDNLKDEQFIEQLSSLNADLFAIVAFRMLPKAVWSLPAKGTINLHGSLLPQYRGAAPINWAIMNGEQETGVTTFFIDEKIDTGDMIDQRRIDIPKNMTAGELHDEMMNVGATLLVDTIQKISQGSVKTKQQDFSSDLKPAPKIFRKDCRIDLNKGIREVHNFIRGLSPYPAAWLAVSRGGNKKKSLKLFQSAIESQRNGGSPAFFSESNELYLRLKDGVLRIDEVQLEGKKKMKSSQFLTGFNPEEWEIITPD